MRKHLLFVFLLLVISNFNAQDYWQESNFSGISARKISSKSKYYKLNINQLNLYLNDTPNINDKSRKDKIIKIPTSDGKLERFSVRSFPVMDAELAAQYNLGSYIGEGIDDPSKTIRFSTAPNDFQAMIIKDGVYEFIEPANTDKNVYALFKKSKKSETGFFCKTSETIEKRKEINNLVSAGNKKVNSLDYRIQSSDKKYRTLRLALSVTGEYTAYFGGTVSGALTAINATLTRVNGVMEKDLAVHLNLVNNTTIIYTNANTDPYSDSDFMDDWNAQLMNTLRTAVGNANFDIGHLFGATGGGGNAGCIGCVCSNDTTLDSYGSPVAYKGSGYTSPADGVPSGDTFDIDYVTHELGHQLGANHTFSHDLEGTGVNMEPGSGSTIMGYAGITGATTDVQSNSDPYFHFASINQIQSNLISTTCDVETAIANNPPTITALANYTIPKSTAFVLTASATDPEGNALTYTWEQADDASVSISNANLGNTTSGASFRSLTGTSNPTRYFPKLSAVLAGNLKNLSDWEAVSTVARVSNFKVTVRDNNVAGVQTQTANQQITVGNDGPFAINSSIVYNNANVPFTWDVVNTNAAPYNVTNVKIDYTTNNGSTWTVISNSTPNDGSEILDFSSFATNANLKIRVSAIGNVFYAIKNVIVTQASICNGTAPSNISVSSITTNSAQVSWGAILNATYSLRYRKIGDTNWTTVTTSSTSYTISGLTINTSYEVQVAAVCSSVTGTYSTSNNFSTQGLTYCTLKSLDNSYEYIANVTLGTMSSNSFESFYTDYTTDSSRLITLVKGSTNNTLSVTKAWADPNDKYDESVAAWIDFNQNGVFDDAEQIMATDPDQLTPVSVTFTVPSDAVLGTTRLRVLMTDPSYSSIQTCGELEYGEVEDYKVNITSTLSTSEFSENNIQIFPNPAVDVLNITKVSNNATFAIYNVAGQFISKGKVTNNKVNVATLAKGVYFIEISEKGATSKMKFIKK